MAIAPGSYTLGPADGTLTVRTGKAGAAAKAGHRLVIEVTSWRATLDLAGIDLLGTSAPIAFDLAAGDDGRLTGSTRFKQTDWGIKPFSVLFGTLKVADEVEVGIDARLPATSPATP
jgi:hypothetical protein